MDLSGYHVVMIVKTGDVEGHVYRRGSRHTVDGPTLQALRDGDLVDEPSIKAADSTPNTGAVPGSQP